MNNVHIEFLEYQKKKVSHSVDGCKYKSTGNKNGLLINNTNYLSGKMHTLKRGKHIKNGYSLTTTNDAIYTMANKQANKYKIVVLDNTPYEYKTLIKLLHEQKIVFHEVDDKINHKHYIEFNDRVANVYYTRNVRKCANISTLRKSL